MTYRRGATVFCIILSVLLASPPSPAQNIDWLRVHETTARGIDHLYNLDIDRAEQSFDSVSHMAPGDPRGPFFQSILHFYLYGLNRSEDEYNRFLEHADEVIEVCERLLDQNENDANTMFYLGGIYGYRGLAYQIHGSILKAVQDGRKGFGLLEDAVRLNPRLYDAHMGFGLFRYLVAKAPRGYSWILSVIGFDGDLEGGLASLKLAADKGVYTRAEARLYLWQFLNAEGRTEEALPYMLGLLRDYPDNSLFAVLYAGWLMRSDSLDAALTWALKAEDINTRKSVKYGEEFIYSTLGGIYFTKGEFQKAKSSYTAFVEKVQHKEYVSTWISYRYAVSCELTGDRSKAVEICRRMKPTNEGDRDRDAYYYRKGQELATAPLGGAAVLVIRAGSALSLKRYKDALRLYGEAERLAGGDVDLRARALYGAQQVQYQDGNDSAVVSISRQLVALQPPTERWLIPHGYLTFGRALRRQGNVQEARAAFEAAKKYDEYDFQHSLEEHVNEELKQLSEKP